MKKRTVLIASLLSAILILSSCTKELGSSDSSSSPQPSDAVTTTPTVTASETTVQTPATPPPETIVSVPRENEIPNISTSRYGYYLLDADEKAAYDQFEKALRNFQTSVTLTRPLEKETVRKIIRLLVLEEADIYYLGDYNMNFNKLTEIVSYVTFSYRFTQTEVQQLDAAANQRFKEILDKVPDGATDIAKIKIFHDQIILNCVYDLDYTYGATPYGALVAGQALCEGYARAFAILCNKAGIENLFAIGEYDGIDHKWNMVRVDGNWYNIDLTWDDPPLDAKGTKNPDYYIQYNYYMYKNGQSGVNLTVDESLFPLPATESGLYNYFVYYGYYAKTYDEAVQKLAQQLDSALQNGRKYIRLKFSSAELYNEACYRLVDNEGDHEIFNKDIYPFGKVKSYIVYRDPQLNIIQLQINGIRETVE